MQIIKKMRIKKKLYTDEPMHCWKRGCPESLNGLMRYTLNFGKGFVMEMWLCNKHEIEFDKIKSQFKENKN